MDTREELEEAYRILGDHEAEIRDKLGELGINDRCLSDIRQAIWEILE